MYYGEGDGAFGPNDNEIDNFDSFYTIYIYIYIFIYLFVKEFILNMELPLTSSIQKID